MSVYIIFYVCFFFVVRKEVKKENAEKNTGKKHYSKTQMEGNSKLCLCYS